MIIELPNNESATLRTYGELSERSARRIRSALRGALEQTGQMMAKGFDETDPSTWAALENTGEDSTSIEIYQDRCIVEMVKAWTLGDLPTMESVGDLPAKTYEVIAEKSVEAARGEEFSVEGATDPKAPTDA